MENYKFNNFFTHIIKSLKSLINSLNYEVIPEYVRQTPILGINRLRIGTDGHGITTLVAFSGCHLDCKYCLNPECKHKEKAKYILPEEVMNELRKDELYYIATNGGITFGGGEPLLNSKYIKDILELGAKKWNITVETSLNVPLYHIKLLFPYINEYVIDIKDMNPNIYQKYTGHDNQLVKENLQWLIEHGMSEHIICRIPLIPNYNCKSDQEKSKEELLNMGIKKFDIFSYTVEEKQMKVRLKNKLMGRIALK